MNSLPQDWITQHQNRNQKLMTPLEMLTLPALQFAPQLVDAIWVLANRVLAVPES